MSGELAVMDRTQMEEALSLTEGLTHIDVKLGPDSKNVRFEAAKDAKGSATLIVNDQEFPMTQRGLFESARAAHLPEVFSRMCPEELLLYNVNYMFPVCEGKLRFFIQNGVVFGAHANQSKYYSNLELVTAAEDVLGRDHIAGYHAATTDLDYSRVAIVTDHVFEPVPDDTIHGGVTIRNSIAGEHKIQIAPYLFRQWCSNGSYVSENVAEWSHRWDDKVDMRSWIQSHTDLAYKSLDNEFRRIQQLLEQSVEGHASDALRSLFNKFDIPMRVQDEVTTAAAASNSGAGPRTMYDLWNAFTYVGTHSNNISRTSSDLLKTVAGEVTREVELCSNCHQLLPHKD